MASLGANYGGKAFVSFLGTGQEQHSRMGRTQSFFSEEVKKFNSFQPRRQQMRGDHRRLTVVGKLDDCSTMSSRFRSSPPDQILSDPVSRFQRETINVNPMKKTVDGGNVSAKLDQWMRDSVTEIVRNIGEAPFLVHIYSESGKGSSSNSTGVRLVREKAVAENWPVIKGRWEGGSPAPNGIILVEELASRELDIGPDEDDVKSDGVIGMNSSQMHPTTKIWGVLIQGRGLDCSACYILKTCRVQSLLGFCTHFCLVRVDCFVEDAGSQLKKFWLQRW